MALNSGKILMRRGQEVNFDPNKMTPGEWAVSLDSKYVRMCFQPGVCVRMATYDAFEADMVQIQRILAECQTIEEVVNRINDEVSAKAQAVAEYTEQAKQYRDEAEQFRNQSFASTPEGYLELVEQVEENTRKIAEGVGGVSSYNELENKPKINDVVLEGNRTIDELGGLTEESTVSFSQASERTNIEATDNVKGIFGKVKKWFADLKPHAFSNPTNNLLATEAGTALDAVQGKVLYDRDIDMSVGRLPMQAKNRFATIEEFVQETAKNINIPVIARMQDTTGAWGPGGKIQWYKCLVVYQNAYGTNYSLGGNGFMWDDAGNRWSITITGNSHNAINFKHEKLTTETELNNVTEVDLMSKCESVYTPTTAKALIKHNGKQIYLILQGTLNTSTGSTNILMFTASGIKVTDIAWSNVYAYIEDSAGAYIDKMLYAYTTTSRLVVSIPSDYRNKDIEVNIKAELVLK